MIRCPKMYILLFFSLIWTITSSYTQSRRFIYEHFSADDGLNHDMIEYVYVDSEGYVWFALTNGLQQFDGFSFKQYSYNSNDPNSISDNFLTTLFEDRKGKIWIGTFSNGLEMYDKETGIFHHFRHDPDNPNTLTGNRIPADRKVITEDKKGYLWVNTDKGLNRLEPSSGFVERFYGDYGGHLLYDSTAHILWIADRGLKSFDLSDYTIQDYEFPGNVDADKRYVNSILMDDEGKIWMGLNSGLMLFDSYSRSFIDAENYILENFNKEESGDFWINKNIKSIYLDYRGAIWLAIGKSLYRLDPLDGRINIISHKVGNPNSLLGEEITGIYGNRKGVLWVTNLNKGITKINISTKNFDYYAHDPYDPNSLSGATVRSIYLDRRGHLWVGTFNNGLNRLVDGKTEKVIHYRHEPDNKRSLSSNYITSIYVDCHDRLWVGTFEDGLCYAENIYSTEPLRFNRFKPHERLEIHEFTEDLFGRIWISTEKGFYLFHPEEDTIRKYGNYPNQLSLLQEINIQSVYIRSPGEFWLASWNRGLCKFYINSDSLINGKVGRDSLVIYDQIRDVQGKLIDNRFINIYGSEEGHIWLGSNVNGLVKALDKNKCLEFHTYDKNWGAPANSVFGITGDKWGNIWISTSDGLGKFNPSTEDFTNYYESDGLQSDVFMWDAVARGSDGRIFFGGINGLNSFYPDDIIDNRTKVEVFISKLVLGNREINIGDRINNRQVLSKNIRFTDKIILTKKESSFSLEFLALDNIDPQECRYQYKMEGFDQEWQNASSDRRYVTYTNLEPDTYVFKVRAANSDGYWNTEEASLLIEIIPPFWKTWWAYIMYLVVFLGLLYLLQWQILKLDRLKHNLKLEELRHEKDNELSQLKLNFFTNLSHEFRTPLTLILGPVENILKSPDTSTRIRHQLEMVDKNARRLLKITNQLLRFRKQDFDRPNIKAAKGNIVKFIEEITLAFRQHAQIHQIDFSLNYEEKKIPIWYERDKMEVVLFNLLSNSFKFTNPGGRISISVARCMYGDEHGDIADDYAVAEIGTLPKSCSEWVEIKVKDNGCGISGEHLNGIFKRYYQINQPDFENLSGSGIGLEQIRKYVELHYGMISVISKVGEGTEFIVRLPAGRDHLKDSEIDQKFKNSEHIDHYQLPADLKQSILDSEDLPDEAEASRENKNKVLLIDDNPDIILYLKETLKNDFSIIEASTGDEGFSLAQDLIPDLIISDIMMPGMDGLELCTKLKSDVKTSHIPIILLTARTSTIYQIEGLETGADDYITKPFNERTLKIRIKNLIASRNKCREIFSKEFTLKPRDVTITTADEKFLEQVITVIEENISDPDFNVEKFSRSVGMSHSLLYKKLIAITGLTIVEFIKRIRLQRAAQILSQTKMAITEVSAEVGFTDPKYFSKCFQKLFKITPSEFIIIENNSELIKQINPLLNK